MRLGGPVWAGPSVAGWGVGEFGGEATGHDGDGGPPHHGLVMLWPPFVVSDQAPMAWQPAECALHDPPAGRTTNPATLSERLMMVTARRSTSVAGDGQASGVAAVGPHQG